VPTAKRIAKEIAERRQNRKICEAHYWAGLAAGSGWREPARVRWCPSARPHPGSPLPYCYEAGTHRLASAGATKYRYGPDGTMWKEETADGTARTLCWDGRGRVSSVVGGRDGPPVPGGWPALPLQPGWWRVRPLHRGWAGELRRVGGEGRRRQHRVAVEARGRPDGWVDDEAGG